MSEPPIRRHAIVNGHVQGVFFRHTTRRQALASGVGGWVRNRPDGTVEAVLEGPPAAVQEMLQFLRAGPPDAAVADVEVSEQRPEGLTSFEVR
jgi:acylphosphatase